jgi:hypothetical protein
MKYDIIYKEPDNVRWTLETSCDVYHTIVGFFDEYQEENMKKPDKVSLILGINVWDHLTRIESYMKVPQLLRIYNLTIKIAPDWTVHPNYIELNLD